MNVDDGRARGRTPRQEAIAPLFVALATFLVFSGALRGDFLNWDDYQNFIVNQGYRGLGWTQIRWMFTNTSLGHYMPLTWLTFGLDFTMWGLDARGYHFTNLLLHCANAVLFYFVGRRLLAAAAPASGASPRRWIDAAAALSALLFSLHPLRVESVAWVTERRDVLSGFFYLSSALFYLKAAAPDEAPKRTRWLALSVTSFACSLLSKIGGIALPLSLLVIDLHPLGRLPPDARRWFSRENLPVWKEKIPYLLLALPAGLMGLANQARLGAMFSLDRMGAVQRFFIATYGSSFYVWKTLVPSRLSPFYPLPTEIDPWSRPFLASVLLLAAISLAAFAARRKHPAVLAVWVCYLLAVLPVSGLSQSGLQIAADRYTYIPCLGFALLAAGAVGKLWTMTTPRARVFAVVCSGLALTALSWRTWGATKVWKDSQSLWEYALSIDPDLATAHNNLGLALAEKGRVDEAIAHYDLAIKAQPGFAEPHNNMAAVLVAQRRFEDAIRQYELGLQARPDHTETHYNLGVLLAVQGRTGEAIRHFEQAVSAQPNNLEAQFNLGVMLAGQGKADEAIGHFRRALEGWPGAAAAHNELGGALAAKGLFDEALPHFRRALQLDPGMAPARENLAKTRERLAQQAARR